MFTPFFVLENSRKKLNSKYYLQGFHFNGHNTDTCLQLSHLYRRSYSHCTQHLCQFFTAYICVNMYTYILYCIYIIIILYLFIYVLILTWICKKLDNVDSNNDIQI